jgi:hypothetical protein
MIVYGYIRKAHVEIDSVPVPTVIRIYDNKGNHIILDEPDAIGRITEAIETLTTDLRNMKTIT